MALCVFLGLRNTPLTPIASISHTQLNILHRIVGYTTVLLVLAHAALYTFHLGRQGRWAILIREDNLEGIGAGIGMLVMLMGIWRHRSYKIFYASHIAGCIAILILASLHRPDWAKKLPVVMTFIASMWAVDRMIQTTRICYNLVNNQATFWPLPDGGTRILLKKPLGKNALPGSHCFLWIPRICMYQTHPFTIVSNSPNGLELVIKAYGGFTQGIHNFATQHPGHTTWVSVDGPYGSLPDTSKYDKTIMISGGSGAAFTFGLLNRIMSHTGRVKAQSIDFVWAVKTKGRIVAIHDLEYIHTDMLAAHLSWFNHHLHNLAAVHTTLHVTREDDATSTATATEEASSITKNIKPSLAISTSSIVCDEENGEMQPLLGNGGYSLKDIVAEIKFEKLNIETVICEAMQNIEDQERVFVAVCGPKSMHDAVRDAVDGCRERTGLRIDIHCEDFGS